MSKKGRTYIDFLQDVDMMIKKIEVFTEGLTYDEFKNDEKTVIAVIRCFEVLGEAVKNIPKEIKKKYPDIPWKRIAGMRDKLIHEYFGVEYETLWETIQIRIPEIKILYQKVMYDFK